MTKLKIYNGEEIIEKGMTKKVDIFELKEEAPREGMTGISTRFIMKVLDTTLSESEHNCINPISVMETLVKSIKELSISEEERERYLRFVQDSIRKEYNKIWKEKLQRRLFMATRNRRKASLTTILTMP